MMRILALIVSLAYCTNLLGALEEFRLVRDTETGNTSIVVGPDNIMSQCHIMSTLEYCYITNMVFKWYVYMNSSNEGRKALHGDKVGSAEVTTNDVGLIVKRQRYEDGYVYDEKAEVRKPKVISNLVVPRRSVILHPSGISRKQKDMREARERILQKKPKEVIINHDANTGKDTVVE